MSTIPAAIRLLDRDALRAIALAWRRNLDRYGRPADYEPAPAVLEHVEEPFRTVGSVSRRLEGLEAHFRETGDRRAVFLTIYTRMTAVTVEAIEAGRFHDASWMEAYLIAFAEHYRRALLAFERGTSASLPTPWRVTFGAALEGEMLVAQDAFLGVNAHIAYDLALTLLDVGIDPDRDRKYADHRRVNDLLARLVDAQQAALADRYAEGIGDLDRAFGPLDERMTHRSMIHGREHAWRVATIVTDGRVRPIRSFARWMNRTVATGGAAFILTPSLDPSVLAAMRRVETEGVGLESLLQAVDDRLEDITYAADMP